MKFSKTALAATLLSLFSISVSAGGDDTLNEIIRLSNENVERWRQTQEIGSTANNGAQREQRGSPKKSTTKRATGLRDDSMSDGAIPEEDSKETTYYFASMSLPSGAVSGLLESLGKNEVVVFRGPLPNENLVDLFRRLSEMLGSTGDAKKDEEIAGKVAIEIDPVKFKECGISAVPATCIVGKDGQVVSAHGIFSGDYLKKQGVSIERAIGKTWPIAEVDLEEEIKKRILGLTEEDFKKEAVKSVFVNREYVKLPRAKENRAFKFDPSVIRTEPVVIAGRQIASANQKFNPVEGGFDFSYVVFDATDKDQITTAYRLVAHLENQGKRVSLMITDLPEKSNGFATIEKLVKFFGRRVTIIDAVLAEKFRLLAVPSVVEGIAPGLILVNEVRP